MKRLSAWLNESTDRQIGFVLLLLCVVVYLPFAGNYGMWDPWETHYGEVARQMAERNDWISLWWPGSPSDRSEFWSKTVYTFWLIALSFKAFGLEWTSRADQIASSWRAEWAARLPMLILSTLSILAIYEAVRRIVNRRAALLSSLVLLTASQWMLVTRQVMTDMPFVAPMTIALCLAAVAILSTEERLDEELPKREWKVGRFYLRWPQARSAKVLLWSIYFSVLVPLVLFCIQLKPFAFGFAGFVIKPFGGVAMIPYFALLGLALWLCSRARSRRQIYLHLAYVLCGHASLAKGPAGLALPAMVLAIYLVLAGRWKDIWYKLELIPGAVLFVITAAPWYHAMLIRHGMGFYNEFFGDNYINRAGGRHGDRGTFEYYFQYVGYGMFPWSGVVVTAGLAALNRLRDKLVGKGALIGFAVIWFLVDFGTVTLVNTKFHHYLLPALPALAILTGVYLDELLASPKKADVFLLLLIAAPLTFLAGRDLAAFPPRIGWMFNYDYVNMPGTGRPWPLVSAYGQRYEYGWWVMAYTILATAATAALAYFAWRRSAELATTDASAAPEPTDSAPRAPASALLRLAGLALGLFVLSLFLFPETPRGTAPTIPVWWYLLPTALVLIFLGAIALYLRRAALWPKGTTSLWIFTAVAFAWAAFVLDKYLIELSPHWSQKHVIAAYYQKRASSDEPLIAWNLYWRGENFYTRNEIFNNPDASERTVFMGDRNAEKLQAYLTKHPGKRVFFIIERARLESLRSMLPAASRSSLTVVDDTNNKLYLAVAQL